VRGVLRDVNDNAARSEGKFMIRLTRINRVPLVLNSDLIEHIEATPDTVITLTTGQKLVVAESSDEVVQKVIDFRRLIAWRPERVTAHE
jgi:flagellar protein FlbD